jgi:hypothetical protein
MKGTAGRKTSFQTHRSHRARETFIEEEANNPELEGREGKSTSIHSEVFPQSHNRFNVPWSASIQLKEFLERAIMIPVTQMKPFQTDHPSTSAQRTPFLLYPYAPHLLLLPIAQRKLLASPAPLRRQGSS